MQVSLKLKGTFVSQSQMRQELFLLTNSEEQRSDEYRRHGRETLEQQRQHASPECELFGQWRYYMVP
jgi:DNA-binding GntR family transcriptional regulator